MSFYIGEIKLYRIITHLKEIMLNVKRLQSISVPSNTFVLPEGNLP